MDAEAAYRAERHRRTDSRPARAVPARDAEWIARARIERRARPVVEGVKRGDVGRSQTGADLLPRRAVPFRDVADGRAADLSEPAGHVELGSRALIVDAESLDRSGHRAAGGLPHSARQELRHERGCVVRSERNGTPGPERGSGPVVEDLQRRDVRGNQARDAAHRGPRRAVPARDARLDPGDRPGGMERGARTVVEDLERLYLARGPEHAGRNPHVAIPPDDAGDGSVQRRERASRVERGPGAVVEDRERVDRTGPEPWKVEEAGRPSRRARALAPEPGCGEQRQQRRREHPNDRAARHLGSRPDSIL